MKNQTSLKYDLYHIFPVFFLFPENPKSSEYQMQSKIFLQFRLF